MEGDWSEHEKVAGDFDFYAAGILQGVSNEKAQIRAARNPAIREMIDQVRKRHKDAFTPAIRQAYDLKLATFGVLEQRESALHTMEGAYESVSNALQEFEKGVEELIDTRILNGADAFDILSREVSWTNTAMEIENNIGCLLYTSPSPRD